MAHKSYSYKGYDIWVAAKQLSKIQRGGIKRSIQVCVPMPDGGRLIKKRITLDTKKIDWFKVGTAKAEAWVDKNPLKH